MTHLLAAVLSLQLALPPPPTPQPRPPGVLSAAGPYPNDAQAAAIEAMATWLDDPVQFVRDNFDAEPDEWQADALRQLVVNDRVAMVACKGPGKSTVLAWGAWWFLATRPGANIVVLSITRENLRDGLWKELSLWGHKSEWLESEFRIGKEAIEHREHCNTWWLRARGFRIDADKTQQANTLAGLHSDHVMVVLDEVSDYPDGVASAAEAIFAVEGQEHKLMMAGNPTRSEGPLYRAATEDAEVWGDGLIHITGDPEDPKRSPRISLDYANDQIKRWGGRNNPWVMTNILGQFPPHASNQLIGPNDVIGAQKRDAPAAHFSSDPIIWGIDPAYDGDNASALARRQGIVAFQFRQWRNLDGPELAAAIVQELVDAENAQRAPDAIFIDKGGVGASCYDHLLLLVGNRYSIIGVQFGAEANDPWFGNKRGELWWLMAQWLKRGPSCLPSDPELKSQLTAPKFETKIIQRETKFWLETKPEMRKRGVQSPDKGDALALTFGGPVLKRHGDQATAHRAATTKRRRNRRS